ncbi:MAG: pyrroline-5-carboxylate reductase [Ginsengibacter sp.]
MKTITIIGGGNLGTAMAEGLLKANYIKAENLTVTKRNTQTLLHLADKRVRILQDNKEAIKNADIIILAVKPYQIQEILNNLEFTKKQIVISTITGVSLNELNQWIKNNAILFRAMPNTAISIQQSMTCICGNGVDEKSTTIVKSLFETLGKVIFLEENLMNAATVSGACGIAYAMRYIRASIQGGIEIGFSAAQASLIVSQTILGAAELLLNTQTHPEAEIDKVTTPRGCTIAGLNEMEHRGFSSSVIKGVVASFEKIF